MKKILDVREPNVYARFVGAQELHPLISVIHYDELGEVHSSLNNYGVYGLFIQREFPQNLSYGVKSLQAGDMSVIAVAPGQLGGLEDNGQTLELHGWAILWSPELLNEEYPFFSYFWAESLRLEEEEWKAINELSERLQQELRGHKDSASLRAIITGYLRLILAYCQRVYNRQSTRKETEESDILKRFDALLRNYYFEGRQHDRGLPTVAYCASKMAYSAGYFGAIIRLETGLSAKSYIQAYIIQLAKNLLMSGHNVNETAYLLGFDYPHHFTRMFKAQTGVTPRAYQQSVA